MNFFLNYGLAWLSVLLGVLLTLKYVLRKRAQANKKHQSFNKNARIWHILAGFLLIATGLVHGLTSGENVLSLNWGTGLWLVSILLCASYYLRSALKKAGGWLVWHRLLTALFFILLVVHIASYGGITIFDEMFAQVTPLPVPPDKTDVIQGGPASMPSDKSLPAGAAGMTPGTSAPTPNSALVDAVNENYFGATLKDGVYTGSADAFGPGLTVEVEVKDNRVVSIDITSHNERNSRFYDRAFSTVPDEIINSQSLDVDTVAGATFSSVGILNAVNNALAGAVESGTLPQPLALPAQHRH